jgi:hypothetical protein
MLEFPWWRGGTCLIKEMLLVKWGETPFAEVVILHESVGVILLQFIIKAGSVDYKGWCRILARCGVGCSGQNVKVTPQTGMNHTSAYDGSIHHTV